MSATEAWEKLTKFAKNVMMGGIPLSEDITSKVAKLYEQYLNELAPNQLDHMIGYIGPNGSKMFRKRDIPKVLRKDRDFAMRFIKMLAS